MVNKLKGSNKRNKENAENDFFTLSKPLVFFTLYTEGRQ